MFGINRLKGLVKNLFDKVKRLEYVVEVNKDSLQDNDRLIKYLIKKESFRVGQGVKYLNNEKEWVETKIEYIFVKEGKITIGLDIEEKYEQELGVLDYLNSMAISRYSPSQNVEVTDLRLLKKIKQS